MGLNISEKVVLVTGANRGIGKAIVESFINHGAKKVYLAVRNPDSTKDIHEKYGDKVSTLFVDVGQTESVNELGIQAQDVNIVVNNAGVLKASTPLEDKAEAALQKELNVNTFGLLRMARTFSPILEKNGGGAFVQLNSLASIKNFQSFTTYCASKAANYSITQGLKESLAPKNIRVLSVHPGPISTDMTKGTSLEDMCEPPSVVAESIITALENEDFHVFPDTMAKQFGAAYQSFADNIIEADMVNP